MKDSRRDLRKIVQAAKHHWQQTVAMKASAIAWKGNPKEAWKAIREIEASFTGHHQKEVMIQIKKTNGEITGNESDNADTLVAHFHTIFNGNTLQDLDTQNILNQLHRNQ